MMRSTYPRLLVSSTVIVLALIATACGDIVSFSFTEESDEVTVDGRDGVTGQLGLDKAFGAIDLQINLEQQLEQRDASGAREVNLEGLELQITEESEGRNFDFLSSLELLADADGLDQQRVAIIEDVPEGRERIVLETDEDVDLKPYIEEGMRLETRAEGNQPEYDTTLVAEVTVHVRVL